MRFLPTREGLFQVIVGAFMNFTVLFLLVYRRSADRTLRHSSNLRVASLYRFPIIKALIKYACLLLESMLIFLGLIALLMLEIFRPCSDYRALHYRFLS